MRFATRAKRIVNHVQRNEIMDLKTLTNKLTLQLGEIEQLKHLLDISRQLGFSPEDDEASTAGSGGVLGGETVRDKAILASKHLRSLRFLMRNGNRIVHGLRGQGLIVQAKQLTNDL